MAPRSDNKFFIVGTDVEQFGDATLPSLDKEIRSDLHVQDAAFCEQLYRFADRLLPVLSGRWHPDNHELFAENPPLGPEGDRAIGSLPPKRLTTAKRTTAGFLFFSLISSSLWGNRFIHALGCQLVSQFLRVDTIL